MAMYKKRIKVLKNELGLSLNEDDRLPDFVEADWVGRTGNYQTRFSDGTIILIPKDIFENSYIPAVHPSGGLRLVTQTQEEKESDVKN